MQQLAEQIDRYVQTVVNEGFANPRSFSTEANGAKEVQFMGRHLRELSENIEHVVFPDISRFKRALINFEFKSPLNFIMIGKDFHEFFGMFYHAKLLAQYVTNFLTDSVFSLHGLHMRSRAEGEELQKHDQSLKYNVVVTMIKSMQAKITQAVDMLIEYQHLINADQIDCSIYFASDKGYIARGAGLDDLDEEEEIELKA